MDAPGLDGGSEAPLPPRGKKKKQKNRGNLRCNLTSAISPGLHFSCPCQGFDLPGTAGRDSSYLWSSGGTLTAQWFAGEREGMARCGWSVS